MIAQVLNFDNLTQKLAQEISLNILIKAAITAAIVVSINELNRGSRLAAAILASLPVVSILAMCWIYLENRDTSAVSELSWNIFWVVIPSLTFFAVFPTLLNRGINFAAALMLSSAVTATAYFVYVRLLRELGVNI